MFRNDHTWHNQVKRTLGEGNLDRVAFVEFKKIAFDAVAEDNAAFFQFADELELFTFVEETEVEFGAGGDTGPRLTHHVGQATLGRYWQCIGDAALAGDAGRPTGGAGTRRYDHAGG